jgi:chromosome segregation ATPase
MASSRVPVSSPPKFTQQDLGVLRYKIETIHQGAAGDGLDLTTGVVEDLLDHCDYLELELEKMQAERNDLLRKTAALAMELSALKDEIAGMRSQATAEKVSRDSLSVHTFLCYLAASFGF